jgi:hypothetical protein
MSHRGIAGTAAVPTNATDTFGAKCLSVHEIATRTPVIAPLQRVAAHGVPCCSASISIPARAMRAMKVMGNATRHCGGVYITVSLQGATQAWSSGGVTTAFPRRLMIAPGATGCKRWKDEGHDAADAPAARAGEDERARAPREPVITAESK